jgi:hypothetical protein
MIHFIVFYATNNSHNNMNITFIVEVCASLYYLKSESKYNKIPCFVEKIPKQQVKSIVYPNKIFVFNSKKYLHLLLIFPKTLY